MEFKQIGQPLRRKEDLRLLTGQGQFSDDFNFDGQAYAAIVRSPHAHARILAIETAAAKAAPGVIAVLTGEDYAADGFNPIPHSPFPSGGGGLGMSQEQWKNIFIGPHYALPADKARHVGESVAMVVAESVAQARDAAELVVVDYQPLPAVTGTSAATHPDAPLVWDECPQNTLIDTSFGSADGIDEVFDNAPHVVRMEFDVGRITGVPMEPRAAIGIYDPASDKHTLFAGSGGAVRHKREMIQVLGIDDHKVRVVACDVGGNFGTRNRFYPEFILVVWAARRLGRPVKWTCDRSEAFLTDFQGRDLVTKVALAIDSEGKFLAMRADNLSNVGARATSFTPLSKGAEIVTGPYHIPLARVRARGVMSHTVMTNPYRSAGRPEVTFALERLIDIAARQCGFDAIELRRKNLITSDAMPYDNPLGRTYDSGEFERSMDMAMELADWNGFEARRAEAEARGMLRGLGMANYLETSSGAPEERTDITIEADGGVEVVIGTQASGQGHETSYAQVAADWLGVPMECIRLVQGDTDIVKIGGGSHAGRSMRMAGTVIVMASEQIIDKGRRIAAHALEAAEADIEFADGDFVIRGTDRSMNIFEVAAAAMRDDLPDDLQGGLGASVQNRMAKPVFPNGCHVCEVEVDPDTGRVALVRYTAIEDVGIAINPMIVDGQTHGGIAQGVGQALMERCVHDEAGQCLTGSFMDYAMPRADDLPSFATGLNEVPCPLNPLGIKAGGEGGTTPAPGVVINAIVNALAPYGVHDITMPATPERVWRAINGGNG
ncbi:MAG: xanthine dehydrogenase family protein molybdopterin-binding subunit [Alphaproteobacteria bacterium]